MKNYKLNCVVNLPEYSSDSTDEDYGVCATLEQYSLVSKYRGVVMVGLTRDDAVALAELMGKDTYWIWAQK